MTTPPTDTITLTADELYGWLRDAAIFMADAIELSEAEIIDAQAYRPEAEKIARDCLTDIKAGAKP